MSEQKNNQRKKIFFIQLTESFFETEDLLMIQESAIEKELDPSAFQLIYLKLILKSLSNDGLIKSDSVLTPRVLKARIGFKTEKGSEQDRKTLEEAIQTFAELGLIIQSDNAIFVKKALELTMNKQEESQQRFLERRRNKVLIEELRLKSIAVSEEEKEELLLDKKINDEFIPGLLYCGYCTRENQTDFIPVLYEVYDSAITLDELNQAVKVFIRREIDFSKITDRKNYLYKTLYNIAIDEVRACPNIYDPIIDLMKRKEIISKIDDLKYVLGLFGRYEKSGYSKAEIREAALFVLAKIYKDTSFEITPVAFFETHMTEVLKAKRR